MDDRQEVLLAVWREACRHIEIAESTAGIAAILARHLPLGRIFVRQMEPERCCLETVAAAPLLDDIPLGNARTDCSAEQGQTLLDWCRQGQVARRNEERPSAAALDVAVPESVRGDVLVGPLTLRDGRFGVLVAVARPQVTFDAADADLLRVMLEPFAVALANDHQLRELAALRETAEAEKQSLLARLGRKRLGESIVGMSSGLRAVMERVELVARSDVPVLIFGETGSGKEVIARAIHTRSSRASRPFVRVNCGAIPPELIDSHLFGHERGAFTGAVEQRKGWFERADGGTLLLDEIGELPLAAQVRLLRILQDGWLERVGGQHPINVDVRMVAATHRDLAAMVAEGKFREDLWYRIAVFPIVLPSLRERREDIPELAAHFAERAATRFGLTHVMPATADLELLASYSWPGNVRELASVIDRAAILGDGKCLEIAKALGVTTSPLAATAQVDGPKTEAARPRSGIVPLDVAMREHIEAALAATRGRIEGPAGAAAVLRINPHTLRARMRKLGIDWQRFRRPEM